jgi:hypothetical protein
VFGYGNFNLAEAFFGGALFYRFVGGLPVFRNVMLSGQSPVMMSVLCLIWILLNESCIY